MFFLLFLANLDIFKPISARRFLIRATLSVDAWSLLHVFLRVDITFCGAILPREFVVIEVVFGLNHCLFVGRI
jgi:hypothetical protein